MYDKKMNIDKILLSYCIINNIIINMTDSGFYGENLLYTHFSTNEIKYNYVYIF